MTSVNAYDSDDDKADEEDSMIDISSQQDSSVNKLDESKCQVTQQSQQTYQNTSNGDQNEIFDKLIEKR